jgi:hypothetical protein
VLDYNYFPQTKNKKQGHSDVTKASHVKELAVTREVIKEKVSVLNYTMLLRRMGE